MLSAFLAYDPPQRRLLLDLGCVGPSAVFQLLFSWAEPGFIDRALPGGDLPLIPLAIAALPAVSPLNGALLAIVPSWGHALGIAIEKEVRCRAFDRILAPSLRIQSLRFNAEHFYAEERRGPLVGPLTKDLEEIGEGAQPGGDDLLIALLTFVSTSALMLSVNREFAMLALAIVSIIRWVIADSGGMTRNWQAQVGPNAGGSTVG